MIHQPSGGAQGTASDIEIQAREILYLRAKMNELMAKHTGRPLEQIERDVDRDRFMSRRGGQGVRHHRHGASRIAEEARERRSWPLRSDGTGTARL